MVDILPGPPVAQGTWGTIEAGHLLIPMDDGSVLDWQRYDGSWGLRKYDPLNKNDVLPLAAIKSGTWQTIVDPHRLIKMKDGRVLDWEGGNASDDPDRGKWRLWNYDAKSADILPTLQASGKWQSIKSWIDEQPFPPEYKTHRLIPMIDGKVLDWGPMEEGKWRLFTYDPTNKADVLPVLVAQGQWQSILGGTLSKKQQAQGQKAHRLIPMCDGPVLDWVPSDGSYRLWDYDPKSASDIFPGDPVAQGQWGADKWGMSGGPGHLVVMKDGRVLAWTEQNGEWSLWDCVLSAPEQPSPPPYFLRWYAEVQPMSRLLPELYILLTKPRPPVSRVREEVASLVRRLSVAERRVLSEQLKELKGYIDAIEGVLGER